MSLTKVSYSMIAGSPVNVVDYGAVGDGTTNCTSAFAAAIATGKTVVIPDGNYLINSTITLTTQGQQIIGMGGKIVRGTAVGAGNTVFTATSVNYLHFENLIFGVQVGTVHSQLAAGSGSFIQLFSCHYLSAKGNIFSGKIPGITFKMESMSSGMNLLACNFGIITDNRLEWLIGNGTGVNGGGGNGYCNTFSNNVFYNIVDTGLGFWSGAFNNTATGNVFIKDNYDETPYGSLGIDLVGTSDLTIDGNVFDGYQYGVSVGTTDALPQLRITISNNVFRNQQNNIETPAGIQISHDANLLGQDQAWSLTIVGNTFRSSTGTSPSGLSNAGAAGIALSSTVNPASSTPLSLRISNNIFEMNTQYGVSWTIASGLGAINFYCGENIFTGSGTPIAYSPYVSSGFVAVETSLAYIHQEIFNETGTTTVVAGASDLAPGLYFTCAGLGAVTTTGTCSVYLRPKGGSNLTNSLTISNASANTTSKTTFNVVGTGTYQLAFTANPSGSNVDFDYLKLVRVI